MSNEVLGVKIFQPFSQFRNPLTFFYAQTYPLPPKSTIIGFIQNLLGRYYDNDLWDIKVSVHGGFSTYFWNYQNLIKGDVSIVKFYGKTILFNRNRPLYFFPIKSQRTPVYQQELFNGHYYIFFKGDKETVTDIKITLENPPFVLRMGRAEDVVFVEDIYVEGVNLVYRENDTEGDTVRPTYPTYLLMENHQGETLELREQGYPIYYMPIEIRYYLEDKEVELRNIGELMLLKRRLIRKPKFAKILYSTPEKSLALREEEKIDVIEVSQPDGKKKKFYIINKFGWL